MHISFTRISTPQLDLNVSLVPHWLFFFSLFGRSAVCIISQGYLLVLRSHDLRLFSILQKGGIFLKYFFPELLEIFQCSLFPLFFFYNSPPLGFLPCFCLSFFSCFLSHTLSLMRLCHFFQLDQELLLLLVSLLHFKNFGVLLENIGGDGEKHDDIKTKTKTFFCLCIVDLDTITRFLNKLNRTLKAQF